MRRAVEVSNGDNIIDSRDVIARIEELEELEQGALDKAEEVKAEAQDMAPEEAEDYRNIKLWTAANGTEYGETDDWTETEYDELQALKSLAEEGESSASDWDDGAALIRDDYFEDYARETASDIHGREIEQAQWPFDCIDWERAADELKQDYVSVTFDGVDYWVRS